VREAYEDLRKLLHVYGKAAAVLDTHPHTALADEIRRLERAIDLRTLDRELPKAIEEMHEGVRRVIEIVLSAPEPAEHRGFLERLTESAAELAPGQLTVGANGDRITVLGPTEMARRLPGLPDNTSPRFCAARLAVTDLDATKRALESNGVDFEIIGAVLLIPPTATHGLALEFIQQETI